MSCKQAEAGTAHAKRPVTAAGQCATCNRERKRARRRTQRLGAVRRAYGLSEEDLDALRGNQRGSDGKVRCPAGHVIGVVKHESVDHNHALERAGVAQRDTVRGLLCSTCNRFLGHIGDDPAKLIALAMYLIDPPAPHVLRALDRS